MRKVSALLFISVDGVVEAPYQWQFDFDEGMAEAMNAAQSEQDTILLGRVTYQEWVPYWSVYTEGEDIDYANFINNTPKYVVSTTLDNVDDWKNSTLVKGNLAETLNELKQQSGGTISTAGSPTLVRSLLEQNLLDELILFVHPAVAGKGNRLFGDDGELQRLELVSAKSTRSGVVILTYKPFTVVDEA